MGLIGCPETSVTNYKFTLCNIPEDRSPHLNRGGSFKQRINLYIHWYRKKDLNMICHNQSRIYFLENDVPIVSSQNFLSQGK